MHRGHNTHNVVNLIHCRYEGPYNGGIELYGCGGGGAKFAETPATTPSQLEGTWRAASGTAFAFDGAAGRLAPQAALPPQLLAPTTAGTPGVVGLPLGVFSRVDIAPGGNVAVEVGMLAEDGASRVVCSRRYAGGRLASVALGREQR